MKGKNEDIISRNNYRLTTFSIGRIALVNPGGWSVAINKNSNSDFIIVRNIGDIEEVKLLEI